MGLTRRRRDDHGVIPLRPRALRYDAAHLEHKHAFEQTVARFLAAALERRGRRVRSVSVRLSEMPRVGISWWSLAHVDGAAVDIQCDLELTWRRRPVVRWKVYQ